MDNRPRDSAADRLVQVSDDDSDVDLVTDYLSAAIKDGESRVQDMNNKGKMATTIHQSNEHNITVTGTGGGIGSTNEGSNDGILDLNGDGCRRSSATIQINNNNINMVPIISVTPHSPGAKYNTILEDTLIQLQNIRESVVHMKNSSVHNHPYKISGLIPSTLNASRLFSSCPSLPDLTMMHASSGMWPTPSSIGGLNNDRRKSWTAIEDLTECTKNSHKSVSLSSLDSEEQESLRTPTERLHSRGSRNSTGGISTHSLNEAELARDFERLNAKRNLAPQIACRIPLQKSISTPSIAPIRNQNVKEENTIPTSRHLSDSEDDNHDDRSMLCVRDKNEVYADHQEKRRKRGSLFFRKKKDKSKTKGQSTNCDACGAVINLATYKEHAIECKAKIAKGQQSVKSSGKKSTTNSHTSHHHDDHGRDYYDGHSHNDQANYSDEVPLIRNEFLNEPHITSQTLGGEPILGVALEDEHESWSPSVPKEIVKSLKDKQVKRQEHIYEFIMTEKHHCQILLLMQKVFVESLQRHFSHLNLERLFPRLPELTDLHTGFLKRLRIKQKETHIVESVADILLDFFSGMSAQRLKNAYGEFCSNHQTALETFKCYMTGDQTFAEWHKHKQTNHLLKRKGIPECTLFVVQRLTKYPLLIEALIKTSREDKIEQEKLQKAISLVKEILIDVNARVAEKEKEDRQLDIFKRIDAKSNAIYKNDKFKKSDIMGSNRKLKFEGVATLMQGRSKMQTIVVVVLTDCLFFLQENSQKYSFFTPENKAGVVSLQKLLIREKAGTESRGIYIISSNPAYPEMYELKVQNPKDKNIWIQSIRDAVLDCPTYELEVDDYLTVEQRQKYLDTKQANIRELIPMGNSELQDKMRQKDLEQAILLEEKIALHANFLLESGNQNVLEAEGAEAFLLSFGSYKELITDDCDTVEISKRVFHTVQEISQLASNLYRSATGYDLPIRSFSSVGERQSDAYQSPKLPTRAETFGGFDEKRNKQLNPPWRDAVISTINNSLSIHNKDNQEKKDSIILETEPNIHLNINVLSQDPNYEALQVSNHLHTLLCIINQQMTTIASLHSQVNAYRENPKTMYRHNDQLEELRNLQDKLQEEKLTWMKQREQEERDLDERRKQHETLQKQIRAEQEDIKQQREQLYRKMEKLSSQGILISPNVAIPTNNLMTVNNVNSIDDNHHTAHHLLTQQSVPITVGNNTSGSNANDEYHSGDSNLNTTDRRKDKWRSASISKTPPVNLVSATNAPKVNPGSIKQQLPLKLSSLSSTKSDKSPSNSSTTPSPISSSGNVPQMLPLKLADRKNQTVTPNHSRTGSSPAAIQQLTSTHTGNPATRTNTYPKLPERYRLRSTDNYPQNTIQQPQQQQLQPQGMPAHRNMSVYSNSSIQTTVIPSTSVAQKMKATVTTIPQPQLHHVQSQSVQHRDDDKDSNQQEIYF